jgi:HD-like signal output (HDOD) protein
VGKAILSEFVKELFDEIDRLVSWEGWPLSEAENAVIGVDHTVLGGAAAKKWNLGEPIAVAVAYHHKPENAPSHRTITNLVAMANFFAATAGEGSGLGEEMPLIPKTASFELDIYPREVETITEQIVQMLNTSQDLLSLVD